MGGVGADGGGGKKKKKKRRREEPAEAMGRGRAGGRAGAHAEGCQISAVEYLMEPGVFI